MIAIPNIEIPDNAVDVELAFRDEEGYIVRHMFDIPFTNIVTCEECKKGIESATGKIRCKLDGFIWEKTDFCSYGERRTDEDTEQRFKD